MSFEDGLALTVQWYRDHRGWWEPLKAAAATARA
jgi:dTDP-glucose 4,6-dehydratase